jgi:gamma-glutamyl-gamma-aminobutyrate hydrolase PuuD
MKIIAVSQRVVTVSEYNERRDALDQRWISFLTKCNVIPLLVPNNEEAARMLLRTFAVDGILLTGGNDLAAYGGDAPERDQTEKVLLEYAVTNTKPLIGVCRGMQFIQHFFGVRLHPVEGHVMEKQVVTVGGRQQEVNSYHRYGASETVNELRVWGISKDNIIKAITHVNHPIAGIMWHPERFSPFRQFDICWFQDFYNGRVLQGDESDNTCSRTWQQDGELNLRTAQMHDEACRQDAT